MPAILPASPFGASNVDAPSSGNSAAPAIFSAAAEDLQRLFMKVDGVHQSRTGKPQFHRA
jgi:hypothetical protein